MLKGCKCATLQEPASCWAAGVAGAGTPQSLGWGLAMGGLPTTRMHGDLGAGLPGTSSSHPARQGTLHGRARAVVPGSHACSTPSRLQRGSRCHAPRRRHLQWVARVLPQSCGEGPDCAGTAGAGQGDLEIQLR